MVRFDRPNPGGETDKLTLMKQLGLLLVLGVVGNPALTKDDAHQPFAGRWDLTIKTSTYRYPSWMEISEANGSPGVRIVARVASVHPAKDVKVSGSHLSFASSEYFG
jgi:hypothetical protein